MGFGSSVGALTSATAERPPEVTEILGLAAELVVERDHRTRIALACFWKKQRRHHEVVGVESAVDRLQVSKRAKEQAGADRDDDSGRDLRDCEDEQSPAAADATERMLDAGMIASDLLDALPRVLSGH